MRRVVPVGDGRFLFPRLRSAVRAYGPIDGPLVWLARIVQKRIGYRAAWPLWATSNRYENWRLQRMLRKLGFGRDAAGGSGE